jgi:disulfide oxidoreductase YuzD
MTTKQFNEYVLDMDRVKEWIEKNAKESSQEILDYLDGKDIDIKDSHKKFTKAVQANEFGKPQTVIDVDFTKEGEPTTKDINLIFLA